ncbi:sodium-dependent nutrient amino acid transporter 1-like isoform X1 [Malaya genurostris]|uniref:sodium-dependent nutrient amino acid transporter 1-like isoform X1 n=2 Tax=Malaya genurostris TaxID=325434 RepID=UPI0026F39D0E|nr:sodium-dependent nutrient amino acid transporter 1-like isoform X1 [Malaya genurostris]
MQTISNNSTGIIAVDKTINEKSMELNNEGSGNLHSKDNEVNRPEWSNKLEFLMSCIAMSVGLGNVWRFPFTAYENGGGAFLIPYIIVLLVIGRPLYYLEMILGQFTQRSSVKVWSISPLFKGIGVGQLIGTTSVLSYYMSLIAITLSYLFASFATELPWAKCMDSAKENCVDAVNTDINSQNSSIQSISSSEVYFLNVVLKEKADIHDGVGTPDWKLTLWLLVAWITVFLVLVRGVKSSGKISYFLALFPYVVLITILIRALTLEGAVNGLIFFIKPQWEELLNPKVWYSATTQLFFSLSVGMGTIVMFSSYNNFHHNIHRDAMIVTCLDTFTSLLAGMTIFSVLGNLAHNLGIEDISKVVKSGTGLAFISYPDAIAKFNVVPQLFSVLFFFMMFVLGLGSAVALHSTLITVVWDAFPKFKYWQVAIVLSSIGFLTGLVYVTPGGQWILNLVDHYGGTFLIYSLTILQMAVIFWIYGLENWCHDVEFMVQRKVGPYWRLCWGLFSPFLMIIVFIYSLVKYEWPTYGDKLYPTNAYICGIMIFVSGFSQTLLWAVWVLYRNSNGIRILDKIKFSVKPSQNWGPRSEMHKKSWIKYKEEAKKRRTEIMNTKKHSTFVNKIYILLGLYDDFILLDNN